MTHHNNFGLLRLFAAAQVVYIHCLGHLRLPDGHPWTDVIFAMPGVACFFVISGFLVFDSALRSNTMADFFWRRLLRIYPALLLNILVLELLMFLAGQLPGIHYPLQYAAILATYLVTASVEFGFAVAGGIPALYDYKEGFFSTYPSGVMWTLTVELSFYLVVPLIALLAKKSRGAACALLIAVFAASSYYATFFTIDYGQEHPYLKLLFPEYLWIFAVGMIARLMWGELSFLFDRKAWLWLPAYVVSSLVAYRFFHIEIALDFGENVTALTILRVVFLGCTLLSVAHSFRPLNSILRGQDISYGIYLWHMLIITAFASLGIKDAGWIWAAIATLTVIAGTLSWRYIENPALQWKYRAPWHRFTRRPGLQGADQQPEPMLSSKVVGVADVPQ